MKQLECAVVDIMTCHVGAALHGAASMGIFSCPCPCPGEVPGLQEDAWVQGGARLRLVSLHTQCGKGTMPPLTTSKT